MRALIQVRLRPGTGCGAAVDDGIEIAVDHDGEAVGAHGARQAVRHVEAIERNDAAPFRFDPIERRIVGAFRHGKDAAGIGLEQHLRRDVDECGFAAGHGTSFNRLAGSWFKRRAFACPVLDRY